MLTFYQTTISKIISRYCWSKSVELQNKKLKKEKKKTTFSFISFSSILNNVIKWRKNNKREKESQNKIGYLQTMYSSKSTDSAVKKYKKNRIEIEKTSSVEEIAYPLKWSLVDSALAIHLQILLKYANCYLHWASRFLRFFHLCFLRKDHSFFIFIDLGCL